VVCSLQASLPAWSFTGFSKRYFREAVESPSLEIFKTRLDKVLCGLLWVTLLQQGGWTG